MSHKPRRWYSSPEANPTPDPPLVRPPISPQMLRYGARVRKQHGPALKLQSRAKLCAVGMASLAGAPAHHKAV